MNSININSEGYSTPNGADNLQKNWAAGYAKREVDKHREAEVLDHPDGSVTPEKLSDEVMEVIGQAKSKAEYASETANTAKNTAEVAKDVAINAINEAMSASRSAADAYSNSATATDTAETAQQRAISAETKADAAVASASGAVQKAEDVQSDLEEHDNNTDIHTTVEEKLVASEAYDLAREAKVIAISADSVAEKSLQYWQPKTTYRAGQVVYVTTYGGDYIYKCIAGHTSGDTFSETIDSVKVWQYIGEVTAGFAVRADVAVRAEYDVDGDGIAKAAYLDLKVDKPTLSASGTTALIYDFAERDNNVAREGELESVSFVFTNEAYDELFISELTFDSGDTPTVVDFPYEDNEVIINWYGTDCAIQEWTDDEGNHNIAPIFQPSANTRYNIMFWFDGADLVGKVHGYVPANRNVVS